MQDLVFIDHPIVEKDRDAYIDVIVDVPKAIESYRLSLMSFEVLDRDGKVRDDNDLDVAEQATRQHIREKIKNKTPFEKPIIGLGLGDNFEIGIGRSLFTTLAFEGYLGVPVHVRKSHLEHLQTFVKSD